MLPPVIDVCVWPNDALSVHDHEQPALLPRIVERVKYIRADVVAEMVDERAEKIAREIEMGRNL